MLLIFSLTDPNAIGQLQDVDMSAAHNSGASPFSESYVVLRSSPKWTSLVYWTTLLIVCS